MKNKNYSYVLSDLDGTISDKNLNISKDTIKSIKKYQKKTNHKFSFCTGRLDVCNKKIAKQLKVKLPIIACNGALITDLKTNKVLFAEYLDSSLTADIIKMCHENQIDVACYAPGMMLGTDQSKRIKVWEKYMSNIRKKYRWTIKKFDTLLELSEKIRSEEIKVVQLLVNVYGIESDQVENKLKLFDKYLDKFDLVQSLPTMFNIMKKGVNKLTGLQKWSELINIDYKKVITFGDNHNDIEMVSGVDKGYAMANAVEKLKRAAYQVCDTVENNGVGKELEKILNN